MAIRRRCADRRRGERRALGRPRRQLAQRDVAAGHRPRALLRQDPRRRATGDAGGGSRRACASSRAPVRSACRRPWPAPARTAAPSSCSNGWTSARGGRDAALGTALAQLHRTTAEAYGWHRDNTIGTTPQDNAADRGLGGVLPRPADRAATRARGAQRPRRPAAARRRAAAGGDPAPARGPRARGVAAARRPLVRQCRATRVRRAGDLRPGGLLRRSGNRSRDDRALRRLRRRLLRGVSAAWPLDAGYPVRRTLYNLYHVLNHLNLFGGGYGAQAEAMIGQLLAEAR